MGLCQKMLVWERREHKSVTEFATKNAAQSCDRFYAPKLDKG